MPWKSLIFLRPNVYEYLILVGFGRAPVRCARTRLFGLMPRQTGRYAPPPPIAASLLFIHTPKIKIIHRTRAAPVKGFFFQSTSHRGQRVYRVPRLLSSRPNWVLPPPYLQESVAPPPLDPRGETRSLSEGGGVGGTNSDDGAYTLVLWVNYNPSTTYRIRNIVSPDPRPAHRSFADFSANKIL
jgi:hypothetical protein